MIVAQGNDHEDREQQSEQEAKCRPPIDVSKDLPVKSEHPAGEEEDVVSGECPRIGPETVAYLEFRGGVVKSPQQRKGHQQRKTHPAKIPDQDRRLQ